MNITKKQLDDLSLQVTVSLEEVDYNEKVRKALNDIRRKLEIKGFRKGMVPMGIVQKMYGKSTLLEQVQTIVSQGIDDYMKQEEIHIIGEPLAAEEQAEINWDVDKEFSFSFDLMLAPDYLWLLFSCIGFTSVIGLVLFNRHVVKSKSI
jgi:trigger factor